MKGARILAALLGVWAIATAGSPEKADMEHSAARVAREIAGLKGTFKHFADYDPETACFGSIITYLHGITYAPNPSRAAMDSGTNDSAFKKQIPDSIQVYSGEDGLNLRIEFLDPETRANMARATLSEVESGSWSIESSVEGPKTRELTQIRKAISRILDAEKRRMDREFSRFHR